MADFAKVTWQKWDEATTTKLGQMAQNEDWLKDNLTVQKVVYALGDGGLMPPYRSPGTYNMTKAYAMYVPFDSLIPVAAVDVTIRYPETFTQLPVVVVSNSNGNGYEIAGTTYRITATEAMHRIYHRDGKGLRFTGALHVWLCGF